MYCVCAIFFTYGVASKDMQHPCFSDSLKVGSTDHAVNSLFHKVRVAKLSADVQSQLS